MDALLGGFICEYKKSYFQKFSGYHGEKCWNLHERECHFKGADRCVYYLEATG
jgi:hypothetical protein